MARIQMTVMTNEMTTRVEQVNFDSVTAVRVTPVSSYPQQNPPMTWLIPVAHQPHMPETYYALTADGGIVASAYNSSHSSTGSLSAVVDSGVFANAFGIAPSKLFFYHRSTAASGALYRIAMFSSCTAVQTNKASQLLPRSTWIYLGASGSYSPNQNISARAVFNFDGTPIGQTGTSADGMVYFGW